jgi:hypothetical protein
MHQGTAQFSEKFNVKILFKKIGTFCHLYNDILNEIKNVFSPDTATYIQKIEKEREAKERGEVKDNRSILAKYVSCLQQIRKCVLMTVISVDVHCACCYFVDGIIHGKS